MPDDFFNDAFNLIHLIAVSRNPDGGIWEAGSDPKRPLWRLGGQDRKNRRARDAGVFVGAAAECEAAVPDAKQFPRVFRESCRSAVEEADLGFCGFSGRGSEILLTVRPLVVSVVCVALWVLGRRSRWSTQAPSGSVPAPLRDQPGDPDEVEPILPVLGIEPRRLLLCFVLREECLRKHEIVGLMLVDLLSSRRLWESTDNKEVLKARMLAWVAGFRLDRALVHPLIGHGISMYWLGQGADDFV